MATMAGSRPRERHHSPRPPGTYFTQTVTGQVTATPNPAGNQLTSANFGDLTGTRVENGITTEIRAGYSATTTAPNAGTLCAFRRQPHHHCRGGDGGRQMPMGCAPEL